MDLKKSIEEFDLVFLDLETTGLDVFKGEAICEIGAFKVKERKVIDRFHTLVNPKKDIPYPAYLIHKISNEEVKKAPFFEEIALDLVGFLKNSVVCAYNVEFDLGFLNEELRRINQPPIELCAIDILKMAKKNLKLPRYNLRAISSFFNLKFNSTHRALEDAFLALKVFFKLRDILKEKGIDSLEDYLSLYGLNNKVFTDHRDKKIALLKEAILKGDNLLIKYFLFQKIYEKKIKPQEVFLENENWYLLYENLNKEKQRINLKNLLKIEII
jgi:DNA polymerase III epsilon subunit family exonuclease